MKIRKVINKILMSLIITISLIVINKINIKADELVKDVKSAILMEVETGKILYEHNAHIKRSPASTTKIMSIKLVLDAIKSKRITWDQMVTTSEHASSMGGSQIFLSVGEQMSVDDLFKSMVIASANDATVALAEKISGSENFFVTSMNEECKKLGLENTNFINSTGLPVKNHYTTCYDLAMISRSLLLEHEEEIIPISSMYEYYIRENTDKRFWLVNTNKLLKHYNGIDGLKTGWTEEAGYCLVSTMKKDGMRLISVVMGGSSTKLRNADTVNLLNYGFSNYEKIIISKKNTVVKVEEDLMLDPSTYHIVLSNDVSIVVPKNEINKIKDRITQEIIIDNNSIKQYHKEKIGIIKTYLDNELISTVDLELQEQINKPSFIKLLLEILRRIF